MSGFVSQRQLKQQQLLAAASQTIEQDVPCATCGYNLRGLNLGRNCPECGTMIAPHAPRAYGDAHIPEPSLVAHVLQNDWLRVGAGVGALCLIALAVLRLAAYPLLLSAEHQLILTTIIACAWTGAAWMMTPARLDALWPWMRPARWAVRVSQLAWPFAFTLIWMRAAGTGAPGPMIIGLEVLLRLVASVGALVLAYLLMCVAMEAQLEAEEWRLNIAIWLLPPFSLVVAMVPATMTWIEYILFGFFVLPWCWFMWLYGYGLLGLHRTMVWLRRGVAEQMSRDQRVAQRRSEIERELVSQVRPTTGVRRAYDDDESDVPLIE